MTFVLSVTLPHTDQMVSSDETTEGQPTLGFNHGDQKPALLWTRVLTAAQIIDGPDI